MGVAKLCGGDLLNPGDLVYAPLAILWSNPSEIREELLEAGKKEPVLVLASRRWENTTVDSTLKSTNWAYVIVRGRFGWMRQHRMVRIE